MRLKRVGALSAAKIVGLVNMLAGVIVGTVLIGASLMFDTRFDISALIVIPFMYGLLGFFGGLLGSLFFNWAARMFGGIEVEFSTLDKTE